MNVKVIVGLVLIAIWAVVALVLEGPGWIHLLLTIGVSLVIYGIVASSDTNSTTGASADQPRS